MTSGPIADFIDHSGLAVAFLFFGLYLSTREGYGAYLWQKVRYKLNPYLTFAVIGAVLCIASVIGFFWDKSRSPIFWITSSGSPIAFEIRFGHPLTVSGFNILGNSRVDYPIRIKDTCIISGLTDQKINLEVAGVPGPPVEPNRVTLQPRGHLILMKNLSSGRIKSELSLDEFRRQFGNFTFVFKYGENNSVEREFSSAAVERLIADAEKYKR
jgi:hypothetical protein